MRPFLLAAALLLGAPAALLLGATAAFAGDPELPAPAPEGAIAVTSTQGGETIRAAVGDKIAVELIGAPSTGASWNVAAQPAVLSGPERLTGPTTSAQARPGFVGGQRWQVFVFEAKAAGAGALRLEQINPADRAGPPLATLEISVEVE
jgi:hypothetical protein